MNNHIGFEADRWYKIINLGDNTVMTLQGTKILCMYEDEETIDSQRFQAIGQENGDFRLTARFKASATTVQVWDFIRHRGLLIQKKISAAEASTQNWQFHKVPGSRATYFIKSVIDPEKCLKNMNSEDKPMGSQVRVVNEADVLENRYAHWRLEPESRVQRLENHR